MVYGSHPLGNIFPLGVLWLLGFLVPGYTSVLAETLITPSTMASYKPTGSKTAPTQAPTIYMWRTS